MTVSTLKISELIKVLKLRQAELGDVPVYHQADPEGNSFGTLNPMSIEGGGTADGNALFIFPYFENIEDEIF